MKTLTLIIGLFLAINFAYGQNYMGMSQSKIIKDFGEPDRMGEKFLVYYDIQEEGENIYYFDENDNCVSFQIIRNTKYLDEYQKMLKKEFTQTSENKFVKKNKKVKYMAQLSQTQNQVQILIQQSNDEPLLTENNL